MSCNQNCPNFHFVVSATIVANELVLAFNDAPTGLVDKDRFCFRFSKGLTLPTGYATLPVVAVINGASQDVWNKYGDVATGADIALNTCGKPDFRYTYKGYIGSQGTPAVLHLIVNNMPKDEPHCCC